MVYYSFWLYDRHCNCIFHREFVKGHHPHGHNISQKRNSKDSLRSSAHNKLSLEDDSKLIFGTAFSLRNMARKLTDEFDDYFSYATNKYRLHFYETPTNIRFVLLTDPGTYDVREILHQIYVGLYVEFVVKNPLCPVEHPNGEEINNELFVLGLDRFVSTLPGATVIS